MAPGVTGLAADSCGVAPSYVVPVAFAALKPPRPTALTLTTWPFWSKAMLFGAEIVLPDVVQLLVSSSAMKASLKSVPTYSGYSSERNLKSKLRQLAVGCTLRSTLRMDAS